LKRRLDGVATEPEVVVTDGAFGEQSLAYSERCYSRRAIRLDQPKEAIKNWPHEFGTRRFRRCPSRANVSASRRSPCTSAALGPNAEDERLIAARVEHARLLERPR
jgi:hypothetical protein